MAHRFVNQLGQSAKEFREMQTENEHTQEPSGSAKRWPYPRLSLHLTTLALGVTIAWADSLLSWPTDAKTYAAFALAMVLASVVILLAFHIKNPRWYDWLSIASVFIVVTAASMFYFSMVNMMKQHREAYKEIQIMKYRAYKEKYGE